MKTVKLYYRPSDMKLVHSVKGWPSIPDRLETATCSDEYWLSITRGYQLALQKAIEEALPLENQDIAWDAIGKQFGIEIDPIRPFIISGRQMKAKALIAKSDRFYEVSGEIEIVNECNYKDVNGNCTDCFRGSLCEKIARLLPDRWPEKQHTYSNSYSVFRSEGISKVYKNGALIMATSQDISTEQIIDFEKINKEFLDKLQEPIPEPSLIHESIPRASSTDWEKIGLSS